MMEGQNVCQEYPTIAGWLYTRREDAFLLEQSHWLPFILLKSDLNDLQQPFHSEFKALFVPNPI